MINGKKVVAIIPARGGSRRLPRKNILPLCGKPLIGWSIDAAHKSNYIDQVIVSTDDLEISNIVGLLGVDVPELRPKDLSGDCATTESVLLYSLSKFCPDADIIVLLQPTSPLRNSNHIDEAISLFEEKKACSVVSVTPCEHSPLWANTLPEDKNLGDFLSSTSQKRSQDLECYYRLNGAVYVFDVKRLQELGKITYTENSFAYVMDNNFSIDIDTQLDFLIAEAIMNHLNL